MFPAFFPFIFDSGFPTFIEMRPKNSPIVLIICSFSQVPAALDSRKITAHSFYENTGQPKWMPKVWGGIFS
jgi:hypothetical protein